MWKKLLEQQQQGAAIETKIINVNKGGVLVDIDGVQGFIPFSKIDKSRFDQSQNDNRSYLIGQDIKAKLIQVQIACHLIADRLHTLETLHRLC